MVNQFLLALALESIFGINAVPYRLAVVQEAAVFAAGAQRDLNNHDVSL